MAQLKPTKTVYTVTDFLEWQRSGILQLKPIFQRREVWSAKAKSLFIDTVVKGLPAPIIFLRKTQDLDKLTSRLEVVDGQQRLRTLFSFIDPDLLKDYDSAKDAFAVLPMHNSEIADTPFNKLPKDTRASILGYEVSTHVLPPDTADEIVLLIFSRLNSTGAKLNHQELRNAKYFGAFKSLAYDLAIKNLPLWRRWKVFEDTDFARMVEVEMTSDLLQSIMEGIHGKTQAKLDNIYKLYDDELEGSANLSTKFQRVMEGIDDAVGDALAASRLRRQALFYSLFTACYDHMYGFATKYHQRRLPKSLPSDFAKKFKKVNALIVHGGLPDDVMDAMEKATTDKGRRDTRHRFFMEMLGLVSAK
jgi:uncharacterized protein with ParB-like and HNH nuclease domain